MFDGEFNLGGEGQLPWDGEGLYARDPLGGAGQDKWMGTQAAPRDSADDASEDAREVVTANQSPSPIS